jgi:hypothetical protein
VLSAIIRFFVQRRLKANAESGGRDNMDKKTAGLIGAVTTLTAGVGVAFAIDLQERISGTAQ